MHKFFQFKQFMVHQGRAAMPVTTDACLFGSLADFSGCTTVLDIGAGTGLLSLMLAQRYPTMKITGVEKDKGSFYDAQKNFSLSPWLDRLNLKHDDALDIEFVEPFDGIICNPPFFQDQLPSENEKNNTARHTAELNYQSLPRLLDKHLTPIGIAWILMPVIHENMFRDNLRDYGLHVERSIRIHPSDKKPEHLVALKVGREQKTEAKEEFVTYESQGFLSPAAQKLLHDFYLHI
ncbi:MAG: methyltransferase [Bacteroidetes bacterium]|nr:methyltransferase [Bacteroidota bacterium]